VKFVQFNSKPNTKTNTKTSNFEILAETTNKEYQQTDNSECKWGRVTITMGRRVSHRYVFAYENAHTTQLR
jgi:hypothetical protein